MFLGSLAEGIEPRIMENGDHTTNKSFGCSDYVSTSAY